MSSNEDELNDGDGLFGHDPKKRRIQRACDLCRRKKIRCVGVEIPGNRCSNCIAYNAQCTYVGPAMKRGPPKGYVQTLETRIGRLERLLRRLCPDELAYQALMKTVDEDSDASVVDPIDPSSLLSSVASSNPSDIKSSNVLETLTAEIRGAKEELQPATYAVDEDDNAALSLSTALREMSIDPNEYRFFGKSSGAVLIQQAIAAKTQYTGRTNLSPVMRNAREEFWTLRDWEKQNYLLDPPNFELPEADLADELIDIYFRRFNLYLPLLHRPTFEHECRELKHLQNASFAAVYLLVCALGARFSDDPRVLLPRDPTPHSAGWRYFEQVIGLNKTLMAPPGLHDIQYYPLAVQFLAGSSIPHSCWTLAGLGLRLAQDVGIHRRKLSQKVTADHELWKRAFWVLVVLDRLYCFSLGRPCGIHDEDFDVDLPVDCDDDYWETADPESRFKQPEGQPSKITSFILYIKLMRVLSITLRTVYAINKTKILMGFAGPFWEEIIVAELDSALIHWVDSLPPHLRWDPNRADEDSFNQSVFLYCTHYLVQIVIHRPFIPTTNKPSPLSIPSLTICTNAARSCSHLIDLQRMRTTVPPLVHMAACTSGIILLLNLWSGKNTGLSPEVVKKDMEDVRICMEVLKMAEKRWRSSGRLGDILSELACAGDLPPLTPSPQPSNKRARGSDVPNATDGSLNEEIADDLNWPRTPAGMRKVAKDKSQLHFASTNVPSGNLLDPRHLSPEGSSSSGDAADSATEQAARSGVDPEFPGRRPTSQLSLYDSDFGGLNSTPSSDQQQLASIRPWLSALLGMPPPPLTTFPQLQVPETSSMTNGFAAMTSSLDTPTASSSGAPPWQYMEPIQPLPLHEMDDFFRSQVMTSGHSRTQPQQLHQRGQLLQYSTTNSASVDRNQGADSAYINNDAMAMWLNAPGLFTDDWEAYLSDLTEVLPHQEHFGHYQSPF